MKIINLIKPGYIFSIGLIFTILMILSTYFELRQSRIELIQMHEYEGLSLLEVIKQSATNSILSQTEIQQQIAERLSNNAHLLRELEKHQPLTHSLLRDFATKNNLYRINVFDLNGNKIESSVLDPHQGKGKYRPELFFQAILDGEKEEIDIGLKQARHLEGQRYAVALKRHNGGVIVINVDAADMLAFGKRIGIDRLFEDISNQQELVYAVLQNENGILAATPGTQKMSSIADDDFLQANDIRTRTAHFNDQEVLEIVSPFGAGGGYQGKLRIGLHLDEIRSLEKRMIQRAVVTSIGVIFVGFILFSIVIISQNYRFLQQEHARMQTYTGNILHAMSDAVIGVDAQLSIRFANTAARRILHINQNRVTGLQLVDFFSNGHSIIEALEKQHRLENVEQTLQLRSLNRPISVAVSVSFVFDETGSMDAGVILLRDQTRQKKLEEQLRRKEKLTAMGQLAAGVAHEIRNPLNAISMIVQRFQKEFTPTRDQDEYLGLTRTVRSEIERIGLIVRQFLDLARPPKMNRTPVSVAELIRQSVEVVGAQAKAKHIRLETGPELLTVINVDKNQFHQALLNLLQNAMDAVAEGGKISINTQETDEHICFDITDDGPGIPPEQQKRIFDLYFTTKPAGAGLGLALVHRIMTEHGGEVSAQSRPGQGTTFTLSIPTADAQKTQEESMRV